MIYKYAGGGIVPLLNTSYPMARLSGSTYAAPLEYNQPSEVVGGYDAQIDPMTGEERPQTNFAMGGQVDPQELGGLVSLMPYDQIDYMGQPLVQPAQPAQPPNAPVDMSAFLRASPTHIFGIERSVPLPAKFPFQPGPTYNPLDVERNPIPPMQDRTPTYNPLDVERNPIPPMLDRTHTYGIDRPIVEPFPPGYGGQVDDSSRGFGTYQPRLNPPDEYHPVPAFQSQTDGIGPYIDALNRSFAAGPSYGSLGAGGSGGVIPWAKPGDVPTYGGAGGGDGGGGGGLGAIGPGVLGLGGQVYKNWDEIQDAWDKLTGKYLDPATGLKKDEANTATKKTEDALNLEKNALEANAGYLVDPVTGLFEGPGLRRGEVSVDTNVPTVQPAEVNAGYFVDPVTGLFEGPGVRGGEVSVDTNVPKEPPAPAQPAVQPAAPPPIDSALAGFAPAVGEGLASLLEPPVPRGEVLLQPQPAEPPTPTQPAVQPAAPPPIDSALAGLAPAVGEGLARLLGGGAERASQVLTETLAGQPLASAAGSAAANTATSGALAGGASAGTRNVLDNVTDAIHGLKLDIGGTSDIGKMLSGNTGSILNPANLAGNIGSLGLNILASKIGQNDLAKYGGMLGGILGGPLGTAVLSTVLNPIGQIIKDIRGDELPLTNPLTGEMVNSGPMYNVLKDYYARSGQVLGAAQKPMSVEETLKLMQDAESGNITNENSDQYFGITAKQMSDQDLVNAYINSGGDPSAMLGRYQGYASTPQTNAPAQTAPTEAEQYAPLLDDYYAQLYGYAAGGLAALPEYKAGGKFLRGPGDGMSDDIKANIGGYQEARLADGEFVIPADVVSHLGNGSSEAGSRRLYAMMDKVRKARTGNSKQGKQINPDKYLPA